MDQKDLEFLQKARASNGGGVQDAKFTAITVSRCLREGWVKSKPGQPYTKAGARLFIITPLGIRALDLNINRITTRELIEVERTRGRDLPWD